MNNTDNSHSAAGLVPVILALSGNAFITAIKFVGFFVSGSGALFSEAIHSFADTLNQGLLLVGIHRSKRKADENFSYGYGQERFLWALISACGIFFLGAGVTIYHGIDSLIHPESVHISLIIFVILLVSFVIETFTFVFAWLDLHRHNPENTIRELLRDGDPTTIAVIYEDGVAVFGVLVALASTVLVYLTGNLVWDAIGSMTIGTLLGVVAVLLIKKNREYLIGKNIPKDMQEEIMQILRKEPTIEKIFNFKSSILNIGEYEIKCEVEFNGPALMKEISRNGFIREQYDIVKGDYQEFIKFLVDYADRVPRLMGNRIDKIEKRIQDRFPQVKHIDIEIN